MAGSQGDAEARAKLRGLARAASELVDRPFSGRFFGLYLGNAGSHRDGGGLYGTGSAGRRRLRRGRGSGPPPVRRAGRRRFESGRICPSFQLPVGLGGRAPSPGGSGPPGRSPGTGVADTPQRDPPSRHRLRARGRRATGWTNHKSEEIFQSVGTQAGRGAGSPLPTVKFSPQPKANFSQPGYNNQAVHGQQTIVKHRALVAGGESEKGARRRTASERRGPRSSGGPGFLPPLP